MTFASSKGQYLVVPLLEWQRVRQGEPVTMHLEVGRLAVTTVSFLALNGFEIS